MAEPVIVMSAEQVRELVREAVAEALGARAEPPRYIMISEVAEMLLVCEKTVSRLVRTEGLPEARMVGRERRFDRAAVVAWMNARPAPVTRLRPVR